MAANRPRGVNTTVAHGIVPSRKLPEKADITVGRISVFREGY